MSFTLRQVTQRAGGGEIVRTKKIEAESISIGRGTDCDLQLPDLAVSLRHARMTQAGGRVTVEAEPGQSFEADGKFTSRATLEVASRPRLVFGGHVLTLEPGQAGEVVITVERLDAREGAAGDDETRTFSPGASGLSKRATAWTLGSLIVVLCLALPIWAFYGHENPRIHADQQWSSGPLSKAHAFLEKDCQACHQQAFVAIRDEACLTCHRADPASQRLAALRVKAWGGPVPPKFVSGHAPPGRLMRATPLPADFGGKLVGVFRRTFNHPNSRCASCHREHLDADGKAMATGSPPKGAAPKGPVRDVPALVQAQDCAACHGKMKSRLADTGLVDTPSWSKHPEFRPVVIASPGGAQPKLIRVSMAAAPTERSGLKFPHDTHLSATGGVARMAQLLGSARTAQGGLDCAACHRPDVTGSSYLPIEMTRDCSSCHSLAYARVGGALKLLPHGKPDQVVATLQAFYGSGAARTPGPMPGPTWSRRLPGAAADTRQGARVASFGGPTAIASAVRGTFSAGGACYDCHTVVAPGRPDSLAYGIVPVRLTARYLPRGAFDHAVRAHRQDTTGRSTCADCHKGQTSNRAEDLLLPTIARCAECHGKTPAQVKGAAKVAAGADCAECHSYHYPAKPERPLALVDRIAVGPRAKDRN